jgi:hypothetical protein
MQNAECRMPTSIFQSEFVYNQPSQPQFPHAGHRMLANLHALVQHTTSHLYLCASTNLHSISIVNASFLYGSVLLLLLNLTSQFVY